MKFYTSVNKVGKNILFRGYENGRRVEFKHKFRPSLFIDSDTPTKYTTLEGYPVKKMSFEDMNEAYDFTKENGEISNFNIYGMQDYTCQYINDKYPGEIDFTPSLINVAFLDIEVMSDKGFPHADVAEHPIISIACYSTSDQVWRLWGLGDYDKSKSYIYEKRPDAKVEYIKCDNEIALIRSFMTQWTKTNYTPDVVTGWYIKGFDIPYLVNRITKVIDDKFVKRLSPWGVIKTSQDPAFQGREAPVVHELYGIQTLDYLDLFKKFAFAYGTSQPSYKLDHIASVVLDEKKLSYAEHGSLNKLYEQDHQKFIDYNLKDIDLIVRIDEKTKMLNLAYMIAFKGGVNFKEALKTNNISDSLIFRELAKDNIVIPEKKYTRNIQTGVKYKGAYVKPPSVGFHEWVVSFDLNSMYPNLVVQYNISSETMVRDERYNNSVDHWLKQTEPVDSPHSVSANGVAYTKEFQGFLPKIMGRLYDSRIVEKKLAKEAKNKYKETGDIADRDSYERYDNSQHALKILLNSIYGATGNQFFRYYDLDVATSITLSGQLSNFTAQDAINKEMNRIMKTDDKDYVLYMDTDSVYINFNDLVKKFKPKDPAKFLDDICNDHFNKIITQSFDELFIKQNAYLNRMIMPREYIANKAVFSTKKRYFLNVVDDSGFKYPEPKLIIKGVEAIKLAYSPAVCREKFKDCFKLIVEGDEKVLQEYIKRFKKEFSMLPVDEVSFPRGVNKIDEYEHDKTKFKKGTPINSKGAILYNLELKKRKLENVYETIQPGAKIKYTYLKMPNPIKTKVIAFPEYLPKEFGLDDYVDYDMQFKTAFIKPIDSILHSIGWTSSKTNSLKGLYS